MTTEDEVTELDPIGRIERILPIAAEETVTEVAQVAQVAQVAEVAEVAQVEPTAPFDDDPDGHPDGHAQSDRHDSDRPSDLDALFALLHTDVDRRVPGRDGHVGRGGWFPMLVLALAVGVLVVVLSVVV